MSWHAQLELDYRLDGGRTLLTHRHSGPLRILQSLYPEGEAICHNVVVHPPGGLVGGDVLEMAVRVGSGAHALLGTPGATRFYRSDGPTARQQVTLELAAGARLEWLPLETLAFSGCQARSQLRLNLAPGAEALFWDVMALGQPAAGRPFTSGEIRQHLEVPGLWLEKSTLSAEDLRLMDGPVGLAGRRCLGLLALAAGDSMATARREALQDALRESLHVHSDVVEAGVTSPNDRMVLVRVLGPVVEPVMAALQGAWSALRPAAWGIEARRPRIWDV